MRIQMTLAAAALAVLAVTGCGEAEPTTGAYGSPVVTVPASVQDAYCAPKVERYLIEYLGKDPSWSLDTTRNVMLAIQAADAWLERCGELPDGEAG